MGSIAPSNCADFQYFPCDSTFPHRFPYPALRKVDHTDILYSTSFLTCPISAINSTVKILSHSFRFADLIPDITPSHVHSSIDPSGSPHSLPSASFYVISSALRSAFPANKVVLSRRPRLALQALSASPGYASYPLAAHSPHFYLQISLHWPISPVQHRALYKKSLC